MRLHVLLLQQLSAEPHAVAHEEQSMQDGSHMKGLLCRIPYLLISVDDLCGLEHEG